jgi:DNA polymerase (family 10)
MKKGYKLSEYGLFKNKKYICGKTEKEIYSKLGLPFIPPELRENIGELSKPVPNLIGYNSIKGDLQMHSKYSDGNNTILEMARACEKMGYKYMALTDHSKSQRIAHGMDLPTLRKYLKEIAKVQKQVKIRILKGAEVDILKDGSLDYPDKILKELDLVLAAVHSGFKQSESAMTKRICTAIENPHVNILAHPTGRLIGVRSGYAINLGKICEVAKKNKVALEIDSFPSRLDLNDVNARFALSKGCKIAINTDSHSTDHLSYIEYGIGQARRAGAESKDVINTWPLARLEKFLRKK